MVEGRGEEERASGDPRKGRALRLGTRLYRRACVGGALMFSVLGAWMGVSATNRKGRVDEGAASGDQAEGEGPSRIR